MNTLPRAVTAQWFKDAEAYLALRRHWRRLIQSDRRRSLNAAHHLLYMALLGKDWRRAFTPPSNPRKLANGAFVSWALFGALARFSFAHHQQELLAPFEGLVSAAMLEQLRPLLPRPGRSEYQAAQYVPRNWPFEAYCVPRSAIQAPHAETRHG